MVTDALSLTGLQANPYVRSSPAMLIEQEDLQRVHMKQVPITANLGG